ncbi:MAG: hypothetical protein ACXWLR_02275 [Myxococcales bacterium]
MLTRIVIPALAAAALIAAAAPADAPPCAADIRRFCEGKAPLDLFSCLQSHQPDLSETCRQRIESTLVRFQDAKLDCEPDAFAWCREAAPGEAMVTCLSKHQGELTRRCQSVFDDFARREAANKTACAGDAGRLCPNAKPGKGDVHLCLIFHGTDLSAACREALSR